MKFELFFERIYPFAIALLAGAAWYYSNLKFPINETKEVLASAISLGAILTGFIATAKAILAALPSDSVMRHLRSSGYIDDLIDYLASSLYGCLAFSVYCLVGFFVSPLSNLYVIIWMMLGAFALSAFFRVVRILLKILKFAPPNT